MKYEVRGIKAVCREAENKMSSLEVRSQALTLSIHPTIKHLFYT
jgi:hypothetical protein